MPQCQHMTDGGRVDNSVLPTAEFTEDDQQQLLSLDILRQKLTCISVRTKCCA